MSPQYENIAFLHIVLYRARVAIDVLKSIYPTWKFQVKWGPPASVPSTGYNFPSTPPSDFTPKFTLLAAEVALFRPGHNVWITGGPSVIPDPMKTYSANQPQTASSTPGVPYDVTKPIPSPMPGPACWPCLDTIYIV